MNRRDFFKGALVAGLAAFGIKVLPRQESKDYGFALSEKASYLLKQPVPPSNYQSFGYYSIQSYRDPVAHYYPLNAVTTTTYAATSTAALSTTKVDGDEDDGDYYDDEF